MGAVAAIKRDGKVYLATDRLFTLNGFYRIQNSKNNLRIHRLKNGILIGTCGTIVSTQPLWINASWFNVPKGKEFDKEFVVTSIVPNLMQAICDKEQLEINDKGQPYSDSTYIVANKEHIYIIDNNFAVKEAEDIAVISKNRAYQFLLGYLLGNEEKDIEKLFCEAFKRCKKEYVDISGEIAIINTESDEVVLCGGDTI